jgi:hypothetical protein
VCVCVCVCVSEEKGRGGGGVDTCSAERRMVVAFAGLISQGYWENSKWYFVNVESGNVADKLQPKNINV